MEQIFKELKSLTKTKDLILKQLDKNEKERKFLEKQYDNLNYDQNVLIEKLKEKLFFRKGGYQ